MTHANHWYHRHDNHRSRRDDGGMTPGSAMVAMAAFGNQTSGRGEQRGDGK